MFDAITDKMSQALRHLRGLHKISETNITDTLRDIRQALLAADVHFKVARDFVESVKEACLGQSVVQSVTPGQQAIKIIHDELVKLLGGEIAALASWQPKRILMLGLHGSGKTTSSVKLARLLTQKGGKPMVVGCDVYRPAAIDQLQILAQREAIPFYSDKGTQDVCRIAQDALGQALSAGASSLIFDTAGRLQIDEALVDELKRLQSLIQADERLLVVDAALGQEAVNVAKHFHEALDLTGIILTKLDGDARGGAALSMKAITGVPIRFMGMGEKMDQLEVFHPDRMAQRILGMGDVVSLVEKAQAQMDASAMSSLSERFMSGQLTLEDMKVQLEQMERLGPVSSVLKMIPGASNLKTDGKEQDRMKRFKAILNSMTPKERQIPKVLNGRRKMRIAQGSGTQVRDVNLLLSQFEDMQKMVKMLKSGKGKGKSMLEKLGSMLGH